MCEQQAENNDSTKRKRGYSETIVQGGFLNLVSTKATPERPAGVHGVRGVRVGEPVAPAAEADRACSEEKQDERGKREPETWKTTWNRVSARTSTRRSKQCPRTRPGNGVRVYPVVELADVVLHDRKDGDVDCERDEREEGREEGQQRCNELDRDVRREGEEQRDEGDGCGDGVHGETACHARADGHGGSAIWRAQQNAVAMV